MKHATLLLLLSLCAACSTNDVDRTLTRPDVDTDSATVDSDRDDTDLGVATSDDASDPADVPLSGICQPNRDSVIERSEVTLQAGLSAKFSVAKALTWDTAGDVVDGELTWDLAQSFSGQQTTLVELRSLDGEWFEASYPDATYTTVLSTGSDLIGIFRVTDDAVLLIGVVSPADGAFATELEYDPPVPVLQFPLEQGARWSVESTVTGRFTGAFTTYAESYAFEVDASGEMLTPYGTFPSLRVRSVLERTVGFVTTVIRSFAFATECFGTVATVTATDNESGTEFTDVAELRRLTP